MVYSLIFSLIFSLYTNAAYLPGMKAGDVMIGGKLLSGNNLIILNFEFEAGVGTGTTATYINPTTGSAPVDYVVPTGKVFVIHAIRYFNFSASANGSPNFYPGYADAAVLNGSLTNFVGAVSGASGGSRRDLVIPANYVDRPMHEVAFYGRVPAGKYPAIQQNTASTITALVQVYGYEVTP